MHAERLAAFSAKHDRDVPGPSRTVLRRRQLRGEVDLTGNVTAGVDASDQITATGTLTAGAAYSNGRVRAITGSSFNVTSPGPRVNGTASASVTLTPKIQALLYGLLGPELDLNAGLQLTADSTAAHCWTLTAPVSADASFGGFGKTWFTQNVPITDPTLGEASGPCSGSATVTTISPNPGTSGGGDVRQVAAGGEDACALLTGGPRCTAGQRRTGPARRRHRHRRRGLRRKLHASSSRRDTDRNPDRHRRGLELRLLADGSVYCWGYDSTGVSGTAAMTVRTAPGRAALSPCESVGSRPPSRSQLMPTVPAPPQLADGSVDCWGDNSEGQLGIGTIANPGNCAGNSADTEPCSTIPVEVRLGTNATQISGGGASVCAELQGGTVDCWGDGSQGELGNGTTNSSAAPVQANVSGSATQVTPGRPTRAPCSAPDGRNAGVTTTRASLEAALAPARIDASQASAIRIRVAPHPSSSARSRMRRHSPLARRTHADSWPAAKNDAGGTTATVSSGARQPLRIRATAGSLVALLRSRLQA